MKLRLMFILAALMLLATSSHAQTALDELDYVKKATREGTRAATLAQYVADLEWGPWYIIGPFDNAGQSKHSVVYPPELEIDLEAKYQGKNGRTVQWAKAEYDGFEKIDLKQFGDDAWLHENAIAYLYREVESDRSTTIDIHAGSDDGLKLWFNDKMFIDADVYRGLNVEDHRVTLPILKGTNVMLVKVTQGAVAWDFQMRPIVNQRILALLEYQLNIDFPISDEDRHYRMLTILEPEDVVLEIGGLDVMSDGRPIICTRRGEVWIVNGAYQEPAFDARFTRFAFGLHEPLGARWVDDALLVVQRGELTRLVDDDGDDHAERFETVCDDWGVSGNYHEFAFGPEFDGEGRMWVTLNVAFCGALGKSIVPWRGWAVVINDDGTLIPVCGGLRSPNGLGRNAEGDMFFTDNQGDWVGTNKLSHLDFGDWHGHPSSLEWYEHADMPTPDVDEDFKQPAVWFPYTVMGQSTSDILLDDTGGSFGPFEDQLFVGDQHSSLIMRVFLEQIDGVYQGACFPFRSGFDCGVNRMIFGKDGSMFVGMTNRGWGSLGRRPWGLQRLVYTGVLPFEIHEIRAQPDGFELTFTKPIDPESVDPSGIVVQSYTYHRWENYGSEEIDRQMLPVQDVEVSEDGRSIRLYLEGLRATYVHQIELPDVRDAEGEPLLHDRAYYTLNRIPASER